jgi:ElaB/YqjD/DUF883 family membrane-anchored ribosome-binding protein
MAERTNPDDPENAEMARETDGGVVSARQKFQKLGDELQGRYKKVSDDVQDRYKKVSEDVQDRYKKVSEDVKRGAERASTEIRRGAERARETYGEVAENAERSYKRVRSEAGNLSREVSLYVRDNPGKAVMIAAGVGFLLGLLARRRGGDDDA